MVFVSISLTNFSQEKEISTSDLYGHWVHAVEEDIFFPGIQVYRPSGFRTFPPKRFRETFALGEEDQAWYLGPAPNCGLKRNTATWNYNSQTEILTIYGQAKRVLKQYFVIKRGLHELHLRPIELKVVQKHAG